MANIVGDFTITVHKAVKLRDTQLFGKQDPYVKLRLDYQEQKEAVKSRVHEDGGKQPVWEQSFDFKNLQGYERSIELEIWDDENVKDDIIAHASISLEDLLKNADGKPRWYPLTHNKKSAGDIQITSAYTGPNKEKAQPAASTPAPAIPSMYPPQGFYPPQMAYPPQGFYQQPPPQGFYQQPPPQGYYPPPQGYYQQPPQQQPQQQQPQQQQPQQQQPQQQPQQAYYAPQQQPAPAQPAPAQQFAPQVYGQAPQIYGQQQPPATLYPQQPHK